VTSLRMYFEAHLRSASFAMSAISRPDRNTESSPSFARSSFDSYLAYRPNISALVLESGSSNLIEISVREISAGSKSFFLLVAQMTSTSPSDSNESIFLNRVERIRLVASWSPVSLLVANESISSMKRITEPIA